MKRLLYTSILTVFSFYICSREGTAQSLNAVNPIQSGFAVITPLDGTDQGLSVSEIFGHEFGGALFRSSVLPSPLVTLTSVVARSDPNSAIDTGVAIVNPNAGAATIGLTLNNQEGVTVGIATIAVAGRQQISRFVTELFPGNAALSQPFAGLLFISADIPVGVLGLTFTGPSFTSLPVATQLSTGNVAITNPPPPETFNAGGAGSIPPVGPIPPIPQTVPVPIPTTIAGIPSTFPGTPQPVGGISGVATTSGTGFVLVGGDVVVFTMPFIAQGIGGPLAVLLPQVATGGGWASTIAIANTSSVDRTVRADFYTSEGGPLLLPFGTAVPSIRVPAGGVVTLSTN
jgi:hypothetical protein